MKNARNGRAFSIFNPANRGGLLLIWVRLIMDKSRKIAHCFFYAILMMFLFGGCALHERSLSVDERTAAQLIEEGMNDLDKGRYGAAVKAFEKISNRYPYSKLAGKAMLKMADALYGSERYDEALYAYDKFERLQPNNPNIPYVIYQEGMSLFNEVNSVDRNQRLILDARWEFGRVVKRFPRSEYAGRAQQKIRECDKYLAEYELLVGHFYYNMEKYRAAIGRYQYVARNYPDLDQHREALEYLNKSKEILNLPEEKKRPEEMPRKQETVLFPHAKEKTIQRKPPKSVVSKPIFSKPAPEKKSIVKKAPERSMNIPSKRMAFSVQVGAFLVKGNAEKLVADLIRKGYEPHILKISDYRKRQLYSVRIRDCADSKEAFRAASEFKRKEGRAAIVTAIDSLDPISPDNDQPRKTAQISLRKTK